MEKKVDSILNLLYDKSLLSWNTISSVDIIAFGQQKFNLEMSDSEIGYVLDFLESEKYIHVNKGKTPDRPSRYGLTVKGVELVRTGGLRRKVSIKKCKQLLIVLANIAVVLAGLYYVLEMLKCLGLLKCQ